MSKILIAQAFAQSLQIQKLQDRIDLSEGLTGLNGYVGSSLSFVLSHVFKEADKPFLIVMNDKEEAAYLLNDLEQLINEKDVLFYPGSYRRPYQIEETDNANVLLRAEVLNRINSRRKPAVIITYPDALFEKVVTRRELEKNTLKIAVGDILSIDFVNEILFSYQFNRVDFVTEPGEFSVRGGILDVFSFSHDEPYRIEFFGDEIDSMRTFDVETQLSIDQVKTIQIIPNVANKFLEDKRQSFLNYLAAKTILVVKNKDLLSNRVDSLFVKAKEAFGALSGEIKHQAPEDLFCNGGEILDLFDRRNVFELNKTPLPVEAVIQFNCSPQPAFNKHFDLLIAELQKWHEKGYKNIIACISEQQSKRFHDIFDDVEQEIHYSTTVLPIHEGFIDHDLKLVCFTDHQIFERYHKFHLRNGYAKKQAITLKELTNLKIGDYVTHIDHGIGKFGGLQKIDVQGKRQEAIKLIYGERDVLYLSIHSLHKISKYTGKDGKAPRIYKLGSKAWKNLKKKTKSRVKEIAFNLIGLYAKRKMKTGFQYRPDSYLQHELEASFLYEDTPDQSASTEDIKRDMESEQP
ncbi:MAG: transcription-repair coupling factor, partial [Bacteroidia bacterium]|nr:transcription-repair coupling factor [Bacteroidia bacterium]